MPLHDNPTQAALYGYIAGILDGEGTFQITKTTSLHTLAVCNHTGPIYNPRICVGMVNKEVIDLLAETLGGNTHVEHTPLNRQDVYRWSIMGRLAVIKALPVLIPYLRVKRKHAMVLLDYCLNHTDLREKPEDIKATEYQRREEAYQVMRKLNAVGAAATTKREGAREGEAIV